ncbi:MAG TPA: hypothetical protein VGE18_00580 [Candidatus Paceibacterota bacterium]
MNPDETTNVELTEEEKAALAAQEATEGTSEEAPAEETPSEEAAA